MNDTDFINNIMADSALVAALQGRFSDDSRPKRSRRVKREENNALPLPDVKRVIYSGPKTVVLWADGTKTIVSCGEGETYDHYTGFCAAVVKKLFGSTTHAKKILGKVVRIQ